MKAVATLEKHIGRPFYETISIAMPSVAMHLHLGVPGGVGMLGRGTGSDSASHMIWSRRLQGGFKTIFEVF